MFIQFPTNACWMKISNKASFGENLAGPRFSHSLHLPQLPLVLFRSDTFFFHQSILHCWRLCYCLLEKSEREREKKNNIGWCHISHQTVVYSIACLEIAPCCIAIGASFFVCFFVCVYVDRMLPAAVFISVCDVDSGEWWLLSVCI